jgi:hypothetical protein
MAAKVRTCAVAADATVGTNTPSICMYVCVCLRLCGWVGRVGCATSCGTRRQQLRMTVSIRRSCVTHWS